MSTAVTGHLRPKRTDQLEVGDIVLHDIGHSDGQPDVRPRVVLASSTHSVTLSGYFTTVVTASPSHEWLALDGEVTVSAKDLGHLLMGVGTDDPRREAEDVHDALHARLYGGAL